MRKFFKYLFFAGSVILIITLIFLISFAQTKAKLLSNNFAELQSNITNELRKSRYFYYELDKRGIDYLNDISEKGEYEKRRMNFLEKLNHGVFYEGAYTFSNEQVINFVEALADWNDYKYKNRASWYLNNVNDIEDQFFQFSKNSPKIKASWSFILLEELLSEEKSTPRQLSAEAAILILAYYYKNINKENEIENLIDGETQLWIEFQSPGFNEKNLRYNQTDCF